MENRKDKGVDKKMKKIIINLEDDTMKQINLLKVQLDYHNKANCIEYVIEEYFKQKEEEVKKTK